MNVCGCVGSAFFTIRMHTSLGISIDHSATAREEALKHYSGHVMCMMCSYRGLSVRQFYRGLSVSPGLTEVCQYCLFFQRPNYTASSYIGLSVLPVLREVCLYRQFLQRYVSTSSSYRGLSVMPVLT